MKEINRTLCYLNAEQLQSKLDLKQLKVFAAGDASVQVLANVYDPSASGVHGAKEVYAAVVEHFLAEGKRALEARMASLGDSWISNTVWEPSAKAWLQEHQPAYDLIVMFGLRDGANYSLPSEWSMLRDLTRPLFVINPGLKKRKRDKVLAAVDISNTKQRRLNEQVLEAAETLARLWQAELHIITVMPMSQVIADLEFVDERKFAADFQKKHAATLKKLAKAHGVAEGNIHMKVGVPQLVIRQTAKELDVLCTAIGTAERKGVAGFIFGNTVEKVLGQSQHNVLVVPEHP